MDPLGLACSDLVTTSPSSGDNQCPATGYMTTLRRLGDADRLNRGTNESITLEQVLARF
ncbi:hypothetical protein [Alloactinosynnema sp. L-07]|nr:hypothetical protein [Alloactinosynnema sp. L-07]